MGGLLQAIEGGCLRTRCCLYEQRFKRTKGWGAGWGKWATKPRKNGAQSLHVSSRLQPAALPSRTQCHCCFPVLGAGIHQETLQTVPTVQKHAARALQGSWQTQPSEHVARTGRREARTPLRGRGVPTTRFLVVFHHHSYQRDIKQGVFQLQTPRPSRIVKDWPCAALSRAWLGGQHWGLLPGHTCFPHRQGGSHSGSARPRPPHTHRGRPWAWWHRRLAACPHAAWLRAPARGLRWAGASGGRKGGNDPLRRAARGLRVPACLCTWLCGAMCSHPA